MWDHPTLTKNRERLIDSDIARSFFVKILVQARDARFCRMSTSAWMGRCWRRGRR